MIVGATRRPSRLSDRRKTIYLYKRLDKSEKGSIMHNGVRLDPAKCSKNIAERGIDLADVLVGFIDPFRKIVRDDRKDYGEVRCNMLAKVNGRIFHMTFTERGRMIGSSRHESE